MRDMFYNYEYHIGEKEYTKEMPKKYVDNLDGNPNVFIVKDATGKEIGLRAYHDSVFKLYFYLDECHSCEYDHDINNFLKNGIIRFSIFDHNNKVAFSKDIQPSDIIDDTVEIELGSTEESKLPINIYYLKLSIVIGDQETTIFHEDDSFLNII